MMETRESRVDLDRRAVKETKEKLGLQGPLVPRGLWVSLEFLESMDRLVPGGSRACTGPKETRDCGVSKALEDPSDYRGCQARQERRGRADTSD